MTTPALPFAALLRRELDEYVASLGRRRAAPPVVYVGRPGLERVAVHTGPLRRQEIGWRADLVERAIEGADEPVCAWLTRCGDLAPTDDDQAWCGAAGMAFARHGLALPRFHVLNRYGWRELIGGEVVAFHRIRRR